MVGIRRARLEIRKGGKLIESLRLDDLEQVVLCGNVQISSQAVRALLRRGIDTALLNRAGAYQGRITSGLSKNIELRRAQFRRLETAAETLELARCFVRSKLRNQRTLLRRYQRRLKDERIARALVAIRLLLERLPGAATLDQIRGFEGRAAADYFAAFPALITASGVEFTGRVRRPPPDPVNILLSFGYTLLGKLVQGNVELAGLDPYLGSLHAPAYGRPSLALDLMEELRPVIVDAAVLRALNTRAVRPIDFIPAEGEQGDDAPVEDAWEREEAEGPDAPPPRRKLLLTAEGSKRWFSEYERRLREQVYYPLQDRRLSYRQVIREQVYLFCRHLKGEAEYTCFEYRP